MLNDPVPSRWESRRESLLSNTSATDAPYTPDLLGGSINTALATIMETPHVDLELPRDSWGKFMYYFRFFWTFFHGFAAGFAGLVFLSLVIGDTSMTTGTRVWWTVLCTSGGCYTVYENLIVPRNRHSRTYQAFGLMGLPIAIMAMADRWDAIDNIDHFLSQPRYVVVFAATAMAVPFFLLGEPLTRKEERHISRNARAMFWRSLVQTGRHILRDTILPFFANAGTVWALFNIPDVLGGYHFLTQRDGSSNHNHVVTALAVSFSVGALNVALDHYRRFYNNPDNADYPISS